MIRQMAVPSTQGRTARSEKLFEALRISGKVQDPSLIRRKRRHG